MDGRRPAPTGEHPPPVGRTFSARVISDWRDLEPLRGHWNALAEQAKATIFQTYEWQAAWWQCFSAGRSLRAVTVWADSHLIGVAPFFVESASVGRVFVLRQVRFVASHESDYLDVIVAPGREADVAGVVARTLGAFRDWDLLVLEDVPAASIPSRALVDALARHGCRVRSARHHRCFTVPLPSSHRDFLDRLTPHRRKELLRLTRKLRADGLEVEPATMTRTPAQAVEEFIGLHNGQWESTTYGGAFSDPRVRQFHRLVAPMLHARGWLDLVFFSKNGRAVAANYDFRYGGKVYAYLSGMDLNSDLLKWSPGMVLNVLCIERAIAAGLSEYDLMRGSERYKSTLRPVEQVNRRYEVSAPRLAARARVEARRWLEASGHAARWVMRKPGGLYRLGRRLLRPAPIQTNETPSSD